MSASTVIRPLTTPALYDLMFCHTQRINPTSVIILVVEKPSITLALSGNNKEYITTTVVIVMRNRPASNCSTKLHYVGLHCCWSSEYMTVSG